MNREEAANILDLKTRPEALADFVGPELAGIVHQAMLMGAEALRGPWVKTADRLPKSRDENGFEVIVAYNPELGNEHGYGYAACIKAWCVDPQSWPYWMPLPKLPEVEG